MALLIIRSRRFLLRAAFICVMLGAGGLMGAVAGVALALLGRSVLGINTGTGEFIAAWALAGSLAATMLGIYLVMRESWPVPARFKVAATTTPITETK